MGIFSVASRWCMLRPFARFLLQIMLAFCRDAALLRLTLPPSLSLSSLSIPLPLFHPLLFSAQQIFQLGLVEVRDIWAVFYFVAGREIPRQSA